MSQKTNLNVSPYYDDFDSENNFYRVLFNPGRPVQARELTTLQSILQNQVESFGNHIFKEGSMVIPGNITFDSQFYAVKLNPTNFGIDISLYIDQFIGKKITGQTSGTTAFIQYVVLPDGNEVEYLTIYVKYIESDNNFTFNPFEDGESLVASENITYGNTTINSGTTFATLISSDATAIGSAVSIGKGVYFIRGCFVNVSQQTLILDNYTNTPSYRVGLKVTEEIITAKDDSSLYDNAKGFSNYAAPGSDRFKISLDLTKKLLDDINDVDFVELLRVQDGKIKKVQDKTQYSLIRDYLAQRTYDESGDYSVDPFTVSVHNSLNDLLGNSGLFLDSEKTDEGGTPSDDLMCIKVSPGKAYVRGYDIVKTGTTILDVEKPRDTQSVISQGIPFEMGNILRVNNISGVAKVKSTVGLYNQRKNSNSTPNGTKIGDARVYTFTVTDSAYIDSSTNWELYLYDVQTYTTLVLNQSLSNSELPATSFVKGKSSGATGYAVSAGGSSTTINLRQTSGSFIVGEQIIINGVELVSRTIQTITVYGTQDIKSVYQASSTGFPVAFLADSYLDKSVPIGFSGTDAITIQSDGTVTSAGPLFTSIKPNSIIRYQKSGSTVETYNRVSSVSSTGLSMSVSGITSVSGVCDGSLPGTTISSTFSLGTPKIRNDDKASLYTKLPNDNISSINLGDSNLSFSYQITGESTDSNGVLTFTTAQVVGITSCVFQPFNVERYSVHYSDGTTANLTSDKFSLSGNAVTISGLLANQSNLVVNVSLLKNGTQSKVKTYSRSNSITVNLSRYSQSGTSANSSINDGLTYNQFYGLRVQDEEISLNYPDVSSVIAVYESLDSSNPVIDSIKFTSTSNVSSNAIIGENITGKTSKAIARVVSNVATDTLGIVYLNTNRFLPEESVIFEESNITTEIVTITPGKYKDLTNAYALDKGQKDQYYDYSKIIRNKSQSEPSKRLLIVFDYYSVPSNSDGDVFTVLSYPQERFNYDIPSIGPNNVRSSDTLDFRPRVPVFSGTSSSPFDFSSRNFGTDPKLILSPNETSFVGYEYYLGRIDKLYLDKLGNLIVNKGVSSISPKPPINIDQVMDIATITLPPYLYDPAQAKISLLDNRRYTMRDIGDIEHRVENLEKTTSLSLLEVNTQTLQVQDSQGFNRFKTGFFVDDFKNSSLINSEFSSIEVDSTNKELRPIISKNTIKTQIAPAISATDEDLDLSTDFTLLDPNVQKTGQTITLKYDSIDWIEQPLATRVENVNPFHVVQYTGNIGLSPKNDSWVRTIQLDDKIIESNAPGVWLGKNRLHTGRITLRWETNVSSNNILISRGLDLYMRSRNTQFSASNLKPLTKFYQFFDGNSSVDFVPKLIEIANDSTLQNYGASSSFQVGETVVGTFNGVNLIKFRVATSNHKYGPYNSPSKTYSINPYIKTENLPSSYSASSKILNVDTYSLSEEAQGKYSGYLIKGMQLVGQTSGTVAYVKDLRLISDNYGDLIGTFFLRDPNTNPAPPVQITCGNKTYKLTSSSTNETPLPGSNLISSAESHYNSVGVLELRQLNITTTRTEYFIDPLAQSFSVGGNIGQAPDANGLNDDANGAFLTAVDLFFANKDSGDNPVTVEVRTVELGTPTRTIIGNPVTLRPDDISVSDDASLATKVTFDYPIYLAPGNEYAIVLLAPTSVEYEVHIAQFKERTINTKNLPSAESVIYGKQFALGSLFKSQNGSIWTANQEQDMMFKLYKAKFTSNTGTAFFYNPSLNESNGYIKNLTNNPVTTFPRKLAIGIQTTTNAGLISDLSVGRKVGGSITYGYIVATGSKVSTVDVTASGVGYASTTNVSTYTISGNGSGLKLDITDTNGSISAITPVASSLGNGYAVGDVVGLVTSTAGGTGKGAQITITAITGVDTLYLSNVQGSSVGQVGYALSYYNNSGSIVSTASTLITSITPQNNEYSGNYLRVDHFDHAMYAKNNKITLSDIDSSYAPVVLTSELSSSDTTINIAIGDTSNFAQFEGVAVSAANTGYIKIDNEIIGYQSVGSGTLGVLARGQDSTIALPHPIGSIIKKYELNGISLRRINTTHDISDFDIQLDSYYVEIDRSINGTNRSTDGFNPQLSFTDESTLGGSNAYATENIQYDSILPSYQIITPGSSTSVTGKIRTVSGTSVSGSEVSFVDQGFESVELNKLNKLNSTRIICSKVNETTYLNSLPRNKSLTTAVTMNTQDSNLSPMIFCDNAYVELHSNRLNSPISDYTLDSSVNSLLYDPHSAIYVSNTVRLSQSATSLKVIVSACRHSSADFRVLYSLIRPDSSEISQTFELFPGYDNLSTDTNQDGYPDIVVDAAKNNGKPDIFVPSSSNDQFLEYQFTADNLGEFTGYAIKIVMSGTDQAHPPRIKDLRSIAIR